MADSSIAETLGSLLESSDDEKSEYSRADTKEGKIKKQIKDS